MRTGDLDRENHIRSAEPNNSNRKQKTTGIHCCAEQNENFTRDKQLQRAGEKPAVRNKNGSLPCPRAGNENEKLKSAAAKTSLHKIKP
jgi:hypothetical protein